MVQSSPALTANSAHSFEAAHHPHLRWTILSAALATLLLPTVYLFAAAAVRSVDLQAVLKPHMIQHIGLNAAANLTVFITAVHANDRLDRKLATVLSTTLVAHGTLALVILLTRQFHSNQVMLTAAVSSALGGSILMYLRHCSIRLQVGVIGSPPPESGSRVIYTALEQPSDDLTRYDLILAPNVTALSAHWSHALSRAMLTGIPVRHIAEFLEESQGIVCVDHFEPAHLRTAGLTSYRLRKRLMDIALVLIAAPVAAVAVGFAAILIRLTMGRPIFFVQDRVGLAGRPFRMYKLRTMRQPNHSERARPTSSAQDERITPLGRWLRRYRVDELPQLWNVLRGDMSLIGPRPEWTLLSHSYSQQLPVYAYRHVVRPGITGWAQVRGGYAGDLEETRVKVGYDLFYIKNLSFSLDLQIMIRTVGTLLTGAGAR